MDASVEIVGLYIPRKVSREEVKVNQGLRAAGVVYVVLNVFIFLSEVEAGHFPSRQRSPVWATAM
jgi:hypothetical protein